MKKKIKKVVKHLKGDIKDFKKEASEDRALIKELHEKKENKPSGKSKKNSPKNKRSKHSSNKKIDKSLKFKKVMEEFKEHSLKSGSRQGKTVTNPRQAVAIAYSESRRSKKRKK